MSFIGAKINKSISHRLCNEKLCDLRASTGVTKAIKSRMTWEGHFCTHGREEKCTQGFNEESLRKQQIGRPLLRWEDNIKMDYNV